MGVTDGPTFAPPKPDSKPFPWYDEPCTCLECRPGLGINYKAEREEAHLNRAIGELSQLITHRYCPHCAFVNVVVSFRSGEGKDETWTHVCEHEHVWQTTE
jgi:hypothetical protein